MLNFKSALLFSEDPKRLGDFYEKVFQKAPEWTEHGYYGFMVGVGAFVIGPHDKVKGRNAVPERVLFNFETADVEGEYERIRKLGATEVRKPYHPSEEPKETIATFADPDGNYFQLITPWQPA